MGSSLSHSKGTVLIVEDEPLVREMLEQTLEALGYCVLSASDASQGLSVLQSHHVDLLFSDVVMPGGMNGVQLALAARDLRPDLAIILASGYPESALPDLPADIPLLRKPYRWSEIRALLERS